MELHKNWVYLWIVIFLLFCGTVVSVIGIENWKIVNMAKSGYEEVRTVGSSQTLWQKVK